MFDVPGPASGDDPRPVRPAVTIPPEIYGGLDSAARALRGGRAGEALEILLVLARLAPQVGEVHRMLGLVYVGAGDMASAEAALSQAILAQPGEPLHHATLGSLLASRTRGVEAERSFRRALALDNTCETAAVGLCNLMTDAGRIEEAIALTGPLADRPGAREAVLTAHGRALKTKGLLAEAIVYLRRAVDAAPDMASAEFNLAALLGVHCRYVEAEASARRAFAKGLSSPQLWLVLARALQGQGRFEDAEGACRQAVALSPTLAEAHTDLAQLVWTRTGDRGLTLQALDAAIHANPHDVELQLTKAQVLHIYPEDDEASRGVLRTTVFNAPDNADVLAAAARAAVRDGDGKEGRRFAERGLALKPGDRDLLTTASKAHLASGDPDRALEVAAQLLAQDAYDQTAWALRATAWRMMGDPRYGVLYDYQNLVKVAPMEAPPGWRNLASYLSDLRASLHALHDKTARPFGQDLRGGGKVAMLAVDTPTIRALPAAFEAPIRAYAEALGPGEDTVRARNTGAWRFSRSWSVRLKTGQSHGNHLHVHGAWLSSACYIELPDFTADDPDHAGWLKLGEPGTPTDPVMGPEHMVRPEVGSLVLFPSYMWHGTKPFTSDKYRMSVAFDLMPD